LKENFKRDNIWKRKLC